MVHTAARLDAVSRKTFKRQVREFLQWYGLDARFIEVSSDSARWWLFEQMMLYSPFFCTSRVMQVHKRNAIT